MKKKISLFEALTGISFTVTHLDGKSVLIASAAGDIISHKERKTIKGKGMPFHKNQMSFGDLHIEFEVEFPKKNSINPEKSKILKEIFVNQIEKKEEPQKKKSQIEKHMLEDFNEKDLNKNPRGTMTGHDDDDDDQGGPGPRAQCRQQ